MSADLYPLIDLEEISRRLGVIFPETFPDRNILVGPMASRVVFVFLYGGFVEGNDRYLRPSYIYRFTDEQASKTIREDREAWAANAKKPTFRPDGKRWYEDNSREGIRDDLMRNQFLRLGIMHKHQPPGHSVTSSAPVNYLDREFAALFDPHLSAEQFAAKAEDWRNTHLDKATLSRMALRAQGVQAKATDVFVEMPDGTRIRLASGQSNTIVKALIEDFAQRHLEHPVVLWVSASDKKSYPQFVEVAASVGLKFDLNTELPDLILGDMKDPVTFYMCEVVASDGAVTELRKKALLAIIKESSISEECVKFLSAFEDREAAPFRKNFSALALNSLVWFRTEPNLLVVLSSKDDELVLKNG